MVSGNAPGTLERKIYFYRADIGADEGGQPLAFDPVPGGTLKRCVNREGGVPSL